MALKYADRVAESTVTVGAGDVFLSGPIDADHASFASQFADGDQMPVSVFGGGKWMTFTGRYNAGANSLTRLAFRRSSTGSNLALSGTMSVLCGWGADDAASAPIVRSYLAGLTLSTAGGSSSFGVTAGVASDSTNTDMMTLASAVTKTTSAWASGSGSGSLDTGLAAPLTWYHVFLIKRPDTGAVDVLTSLSATAPTLPANYTLSRRIGSMKTSSSSLWIPFTQDGDEFSLFSPVVDLTANNPGTFAVVRTLASVPTGIRTKARLQFSMLNTGSVGASYGYISDLSVSDDAPIPRPSQIGQTGPIAGSVTFWATELFVFTNASAQVRSRINSSDANVTIYLTTMGWSDRRGRDG